MPSSTTFVYGRMPRTASPRSSTSVGSALRGSPSERWRSSFAIRGRPHRVNSGRALREKVEKPSFRFLLGVVGSRSFAPRSAPPHAPCSRSRPRSLLRRRVRSIEGSSARACLRSIERSSARACLGECRTGRGASLSLVNHSSRRRGAAWSESIRLGGGAWVPSC